MVDTPNNVKVIVTDNAGGKTVNADLPSNVPMSRLLPALVTKMQLPSNVQYKIMHKQSGKILDPTDTLSGVGVKEGDVLRLLPDVVAG